MAEQAEPSGDGHSSSGNLTEGSRQEEEAEAAEGADEEPARVAVAATAASTLVAPAEEAAAEAAPASCEDSEYECRICYNLFDLERHAPKLLECLHTFCLECLSQLHLRAAHSLQRQAGGAEEHGVAITCPLCRHRTALLGGSAHSLPVNTKRVEAILLQLRGWAPLLLQERRAPRLLFQSPRPARQRPLPEHSGERAASSTAAAATRSIEDGTCSQDVGSGGCCMSWKKKAGCVCVVFSVLSMVLLVFAWMEWLSGSIFLGAALVILFSSTMPFMMYRIKLRSQPGTVFLTALGGGSSRGSSPSRVAPRSRPLAAGRSRS